MDTAVRYIHARRAIEPDQQVVAWWYMQEMECLAQSALSYGSAQSDQWEACKLVAEDYRKMSGQSGSLEQNARWPWIQWQLGRCLLLESQNCLALILANPANTALREEALQLVRDLDVLTDELQRDIRRRQPLAARQTVGDATQAPAEQLRNLSADTDLLRCEAMIVRSQLYEEGSTDRSASLAEVGVLARTVLDRTGDDWPMRSSLLLADAIARIENGDDSALVILQQLASEPGAAARVRMLAGLTLVHTYAGRSNFSLARSILDGLETLVSEAPELAASWKFSMIELGFWQLSELPTMQQEDALRELAEKTRQLGNQHGDYWRTRAEGLLVARLSSQSVRDVQLARDLLQAEVRQLTASGQVELACEKLILARDAETLAGNGDYAVELSAMAATLFRHLKKWNDAAEAVESVACRFHESSNAEDAHLWAVRARAEAIRSGAGSSATAEKYQASLEDHLKHWPQSSSTREVVGWLRDLLLAQRESRRLLISLVSILAEIKQASDKCILLELLLLHSALVGNPNDLTILQGEILPGQEFASQEVFNSCETVIHAAWALIDGDALGDYCEKDVLEKRKRNLEAWLNGQQKECGQVNEAVSAALALDCVRLGDQISRESVVAFDTLPPEIRIAIAPSLIALIDVETNPERQQILPLLGLQKSWITSVLESDKSEIHKMLKERPVSEVALARIALALGDEKQENRLKELAVEHPKNGKVQLLCAYNFLNRRDVESAKRLATNVAVFSAPGSALHWSSRWCLVRCDLLSGRYQQATKAARLLISTNPQLGRHWIERFEQISRISIDSFQESTDASQ